MSNQPNKPNNPELKEMPKAPDFKHSDLSSLQRSTGTSKGKGEIIELLRSGKGLTTLEIGKLIVGEKFDLDLDGKSVRREIRTAQAVLRSQGYLSFRARVRNSNSKLYYACKSEHKAQLVKFLESDPVISSVEEITKK